MDQINNIIDASWFIFVLIHRQLAADQLHMQKMMIHIQRTNKTEIFKSSEIFVQLAQVKKVLVNFKYHSSSKAAKSDVVGNTTEF